MKKYAAKQKAVMPNVTKYPNPPATNVQSVSQLLIYIFRDRETVGGGGGGVRDVLLLEFTSPVKLTEHHSGLCADYMYA